MVTLGCSWLLMVTLSHSFMFLSQAILQWKVVRFSSFWGGDKGGQGALSSSQKSTNFRWLEIHSDYQKVVFSPRGKFALLPILQLKFLFSFLGRGPQKPKNFTGPEMHSELSVGCFLIRRQVRFFHADR